MPETRAESNEVGKFARAALLKCRPEAEGGRRRVESVGYTAPPDMPPEQEVTLYGGGALIFDEYGKLKYHVRNPLGDKKCQKERLDYLWKNGAFRKSQGCVSPICIGCAWCARGRDRRKNGSKRVGVVASHPTDSAHLWCRVKLDATLVSRPVRPHPLSCATIARKCLGR
ncbi:MAG: hypothetical protein ACXWLY_03790 [Thermoanaerobaculia bacterium]